MSRPSVSSRLTELGFVTVITSARRETGSVGWSLAGCQKDHRETSTCNGHCRSLEIDVYLM